VVDGLRANGGPSPVFDGVLAEHAAYVEALRKAGLDVTVLESLEQFPDSIFVEDPALVFSDAAIVLNPGAPSRQRESEALAPALAARFQRVLTLPRGHADGGDVLVMPGLVLIGLSSRTDEAGAAGLRTLLASLGFASRVVRAPPGVLHLKSDCALVDEHTVLVTGSLSRSGMFDGWQQLVVPAEEPAGANVLRLNETVLVRAECPRTADLLDRHGLRVVALPTAQIARIDAGLSCMSLRWLDPRR
jgi:dimethylargininase